MKISKRDLVGLARKIPVFGIAGMFALFFAMTAVEQILLCNEEGAELMQEHYQLANLLSKRQTWDSRSNWITQEIPRFDSEDMASKFLVEKIKQSLLNYGLELKSHRVSLQGVSNLLAAEERQNFDRTSVEIKISGEEKRVVGWLHNLQQPGNFSGYDNLTIKLDEFGLNCELQISQWYLNRYRSLSERHRFPS